MSLKSFLFISVVVHSLLFIGFPKQKTPYKSSDQRVRVVFDELKQTKNLTSRANKMQKSNKIQTKNKGSKKIEASFYESFLSFIQSKAVYPKTAISLKQEGTVLLSITLKTSGEIIDFRIEKKSKFNSLNFAALKIFKNLKSFKPLPKSYKNQTSFLVPVNYILN